MSANYNFDTNDEKEFPVWFLATAVSVIIGLIIIGVVLLVNRDTLTKDPSDTKVSSNSGADDKDLGLSGVISGSNLVSGDLTIWNEYLDDETTEEEIALPDEPPAAETVEKDLTEGGTKTKVIKKDGSEIWVKINKYLSKNVIDNAGFVQKNGRLSYYENGEKKSYTGIIVDKNDDYIDFNKVKKDNIDFALIKIGQRGYGTGTLSVDERYADNIKNAKDAGLHVGVMFFSQAITIEEAEEEAQFVLDTLGEQTIDYPVCFYMDYVNNDKSRIENLTGQEKTQIAQVFMDKIKAAGLNVILYGNKEWLLCDLNYTTVSYYDVCLDEEADLPDFPYRFNMWKYASADVAGVSGKSELIISFVDYSVK